MNKYVNPTGEGYLGVATVGANRCAGFGVGMWPFDWDGGTTVYAVEEASGVALFASHRRPPEFITTYEISKSWRALGPSLTVGGAALGLLDVGEGDDVRAYEREAGGVLLVPADGDPLLEERGTDG